MRVLQLSDIHFGPPQVTAFQRAVARRFSERRYDLIVVAGDFTQRNFRGQFAAAKEFLDEARAVAPVLVVPGNHDVAWWWKPVGLGLRWPMYRGYRKWISDDLEPMQQLPGVTAVGLNSCHGIQPYTLTTRLRDLSVVGAIRPAQWERARAAFAAAPAGDLKLLVFHHNLLTGELSQRWGLVNRAAGIDEALATGADLVLCGHDHQTKIEVVERGGRRMVVSQSNTISDRMRGGLPAAFQEIDCSPTELLVQVMAWDGRQRDFVAGEVVRCAR